jgi:hypothetical protein
MVAGSSSMTTALQNIRPGEAWIIWDEKDTSPSLRVLVMRAGLHAGQ